jgi:CHAT domain-containing protein
MALALKSVASLPARWIAPSARRLLGAGLVAVLTQSPCSAQLSRQEVDRLFQSIEASHPFVTAGNWAACLATLDETADLARRAWTQTSISWFGVRMRCEARLQQNRGLAVTAQTIAQLTAPGLEHLAHVPPGVERRSGARMLLLQGKWWLMRDLGLGDEADMRGQDATAREDMDRWAHGLYGQHALLPRVQGHIDWISQQYGQGQRAALILRRAVSFAHRSADRNAEALAVIDEAARLAALHHPHDRALQQIIAGERAPCLSANGLWLEARDAFIALRDGMLAEQPQPHGNLMRMNYHLAGIANRLGDHEQAEAFAEAADHHARQSSLPNDRVEVAVAHLQRAEARLLRGVPGAADEVRAELERIGAANGGNGAPAFSLAKLARRSGDAALLDWAKDHLDRHARQRLQPLQPSRALVEITTAWSVAGQDPPRARQLLERAAARGLSDRDLGVSVQSAFTIAGELAARQPDAALWWYKRGANALQALRQRGRAAQDEGMHRATLADHEADLRAFIALLIDQGRYLEARDALRVLREEELHDFTRRSRQRAAAARSGALAFTPQERRFEAALAPLADRMRAEQPLADARAQPAPLESGGMGWLDDPATEALVERTQGELHALLASMTQPAQRAGTDATCRRNAAGARARPCPSGQPDGHQLPDEPLPSGTARLQFFVRDQHLDILVTTARGWHRHRAPMARTELNRRVHAWRSTLLNPAADAMVGAREFHRLLIRPVQRHLRGVRQLQISLDGALRYLPMAALHDGQRHLVQRYSLVMDDGIVSNQTQPDAKAPRSKSGRAAGALRLAAFGRTAPDKDHAALPGVAAELKVLANLSPEGPAPQRPDRVLQDQAFTAQALHDTLAAEPGVVHIASHFHLAAAEEESSYLLLGDGQRLPLARLAQMPWDRVRLVLLSACDSAIGDAARQGREFNGLAGVLRQAGASHVLASLWPIADASTAEFMREFYRPMALGPGLAGRAPLPREAALAPQPDASWLAQAQRRWLTRHAGTASAHPYHWAAFAWWGITPSSGARSDRKQ